jgi:hypothetical protein
LYVPADQVLDTASRDAISYDAPGARYTHRDGRCTFEVQIEDYQLTGDAALMRLARIVHAADIDTELDTDPAGPGLLAIGIGGPDVEADDHRLLERASFVYDALYAWWSTRSCSSACSRAGTRPTTTAAPAATPPAPSSCTTPRTCAASPPTSNSPARYATCATLPLCIAVGSAAKTAAIHSIDCRCQTRVAVAARKLGVIQPAW